ncbi:MAG: molybdopterin-dependent oxidoreductase, partial [Burkholderiales bacterium]
MTQHITLKCAGHGHNEFFPPDKGNQWTTGGIGFPEWTGVRSATCSKKPASRTARLHRLLRVGRPYQRRSEQTSDFTRCPRRRES